ncbi:unnamed protein product [Phyllotreta striolata]|uniref:Uncharacterized protein n=1 Tax=Phyllotreta striolata TaxID=444603 RepID=A0A9N9TET8_PHYSR|nr:unnamed protein product [Phyllotreta striolata]
MGSLLAIFVAFLTIFTNDQIFKAASSTPGPLVSSYIFLIALFLLLCELPMYPNSLRKLGFLVQGLFEVLATAVIAEGMTVDFWLPLEAAAMDNVAKLADLIDDFLADDEWKCDNSSRNTAARYVVSYFLSIFFLMTVLHATRIVDLRAVDEGVGRLVGDATWRFKRFVKRGTGRAVSKEVRPSECGDDSIGNSVSMSRCSASDNELAEKKWRAPQKRRTKRSKLVDRSDGEETKRQTRSSTCCSRNNIYTVY